MKTAKQILKERYLLIEEDKTCEAHTYLVVQAMEEYAKQASEKEYQKGYEAGYTNGRLKPFQVT